MYTHIEKSHTSMADSFGDDDHHHHGRVGSGDDDSDAADDDNGDARTYKHDYECTLEHVRLHSRTYVSMQYVLNTQTWRTCTHTYAGMPTYIQTHTHTHAWNTYKHIPS